MAYRARVSERSHREAGILQVSGDDEGGYPREFTTAMRAYRSKRFYDVRAERRVSFLKACHLCRRPLGEGDDIYMYKGDTPFCSEECRQEQIELDEATEMAWGSMKAMQKKSKASLAEQQQQQQKSDSFRVRAGTVAAA
ncbi:hypothetical protein EJ110_NYTH02191 [Nymphaea thermarum]|nr:hypothetical protein EJ110_NYTH02191 [Nymphaea thermarum]